MAKYKLVQSPRIDKSIEQQPPVESPYGTAAPDPLEQLLYQRGFELFNPAFHSYKVGLPGYGVIRIKDKTYIYNTRNVRPDSLADLGIQNGKSTLDLGSLAGIPKVNIGAALDAPLNQTNAQLEEQATQQAKVDAMKNPPAQTNPEMSKLTGLVKLLQVLSGK